ncbi:MAG: hypothetical protein QOF50_1386, partial [Gaiellaceae bacterium]|nr:hypothetical protein [Gaiellaceae bacterium]
HRRRQRGTAPRAGRGCTAWSRSGTQAGEPCGRASTRSREAPQRRPVAPRAGLARPRLPRRRIALRASGRTGGASVRCASRAPGEDSARLSGRPLSAHTWRTCSVEPRPGARPPAVAGKGVSDGILLRSWVEDNERARRKDSRPACSGHVHGPGPAVQRGHGYRAGVATGAARGRGPSCPPCRGGSRAWRDSRRRSGRPRSARSSASGAGTFARRRRRRTACAR